MPPIPSDTNQQTWLILSHAFNMDGRAASQTITDKIPHLIKLGVTPVIVSGILGRKDNQLEHHQVLSALPVGLRFDLRHYLRNRISNRFAYRLTMLCTTVALIPFYLIEKICIPIETTWSWSISAFLVSRRIIKTQRPALIYSTGGAYSAHLAGYWLSKCYGVSWIAEIHDPMIYESQPLSTTRKKFAAWLEKTICTHADTVWWFTEMAMQRAKARHPQLAERGHYVIAGVDEPDFKRQPYKRQTHLTIGHFGSLSVTRNLGEFLAALTQFLNKDPARASQVRFHIYGGSMDNVSANAISQFNHPDVIENFGRIETDPVSGESGRTRVLKRMNAADCLLLLHGTDSFCEEYIPSKYFEYLWTQRPVLGLIHNNPQLTQMLHEFGHWVVNAQAIDQIVHALEELYARWKDDNLNDNGITSPYTTRRAVQKIHSWAMQMQTLKHRAGENR